MPYIPSTVDGCQRDSSGRSRVRARPRKSGRIHTWSADQIGVVITTAHRPGRGSYLGQTLASLRQAGGGWRRLGGGVDVVADHADQRARHTLNGVSFRYHPLEPSEAQSRQDLVVGRRASLNYVRALETGLTQSGTRGFCLCEDDVVFRARFVDCLLEALNEMAGLDRSRFALSLYCALGLEQYQRLRRGRVIYRYPGYAFWGCQAIFFTKNLAGDVASHIKRRSLVPKRRIPHDLAIGDGDRRWRALYAVEPSLVQHIGRRTTGLGLFHESPRSALPGRHELSREGESWVR